MAEAKKLLSNVKLLCLVSFLFCTLLSCKTSNIESTTPELTFSHLPDIRINVAKISVLNEYKMPFKQPNVEHVAPVSPGASVERWVSDILVPVGDKLDAQFIIKSGSIIESELKTQKGLKGVFAIEQSKRYTAIVDARLEIFDGSRRLATINAKAKRSHTLREDATPNLKTNLLFNLVENLMATFDRELRRQVDSHLQNYIQ
tara:strand:- start:3444 stop:4049 length:606 start_codon:yes stop_codon:yes gene_type:complete